MLVRLELPAWQSRGVALVWETRAKVGVNPLAGETRTALRRRLRRDLELPDGDTTGRLLQS